ncbi:uncharacterized protein LOC129000215 [Macrosteles quadrilineatus]|uniref:uncharacterized protein LOC129000215 n=1 Tax=Macrosteles quadrilineatus TaxID=74068 RepID=UPI0023E18073|nr:uncharacterized protein LOC129000215 [Macrosteles quadrilineatus]
MTYSCDSDDGFKEPYYDFDSEVSVAGGAKRTKVGSTKPRPKSACSVRGRGDGQAATIRCHSALGLRHGIGELHQELILSPSTDEVTGSKSCIRNFRRSLKLLGLQLEGFNLEAGEPSPKPDIKNAKSKVGSLVTRRSVSLEDLHEAVVSVGFPLTPDVESLKHRRILAKAIYEEWYFKKQEEEEKKKSEARQQQKVKQWEFQHRKYEQMRKSQECFKEWLHKKRKQQQEQFRNSVRGPMKPTYPCNPGTSQNAQTAYESWKKEKEKLLKKQQEESRLHKKMVEEKNNKEDSEKVWKEYKHIYEFD